MTAFIFSWFWTSLTAMSCWAATAPGLQPVTLRQAYRTAIEKTETYEIQKTVRNQADERVTQATGSVLPTLNLNGTYTRQEAVTSTSSSLANPNQSSVRLTLTQPIFRGFAEIAGVRATKALLRS